MTPLARYEARVGRQYAATYGEERAGREAVPHAHFTLALLVWTVVGFAAVLVRQAGEPGLATTLYVIGLAWFPVVAFTWWRRRRARLQAPSA